MEYVNLDLELDLDMGFPNADMTKDIYLKAQSRLKKLTPQDFCAYHDSNVASTSNDLRDLNIPFDDPLFAFTQYPLTMTQAGATPIPGILFDPSLPNINVSYWSAMLSPMAGPHFLPGDNMPSPPEVEALSSASTYHTASTVLSPIAGPLFVPGENMPPLPEVEALPGFSIFHTESPVQQPMGVAIEGISSISDCTLAGTPSLEIASDNTEVATTIYTPNTSGKRKRSSKAGTSNTPIIQRKSDTRGRAAPKLSELAALGGLAGPRKEVCDYCSTCFNRGEHKIRHMASVHGIGRKYHFCPAKGCDYKATRLDNLRQHSLTHNPGDLPDDYEAPASKRRRSRQHTCPAEWCNYKTTKKGELDKHMESSAHTEDDFK